MKKTFFLLCAGVLLSCAVFTGCNRDQNPPAGNHYIVQLRRDALGMTTASNYRVPPPTGIDSADTSICVRGRLKRINREWVVIEDADSNKIWVPRNQVLLIQEQGLR